MRVERGPLAEGHATETGAGDMSNTHLDMLSARMLARTHTCTQDGFCGLQRQHSAVIFYSRCLHVSIVGVATTLSGRDRIEEHEIISAKCSPSLHLSLWEQRTHARTLPNCAHSYALFCINYTWP